MLKRRKLCLIKLILVFNVSIYFAWILWPERRIHLPSPEDSAHHTGNSYFLAETKGYAQEILETRIERKKNTNTTMDYSLYGDGCGLNPHHKSLKKLLSFWNELTRERGIEYIVCYGSLLGYQRNRDFIPYDHDIDICINKKHFPRLLSLESRRPIDIKDNKPHLLITKRFSDGMRLNCKGILVSEKMDLCSRWIFSSAARVIFKKDINFLDVYIYTISKHFSDLSNLQFETSDIYPTKSCWLAGVKTRCPSRPKTLLEKFYGPEVVEKPSHICKDHQFVEVDKNKTNEKSHWYIGHTNRLLLMKKSKLKIM